MTIYEVSDILVSGGKKIATANTPTQLFPTAPCEPKKGIKLKAPAGNTGIVYVGAINVSTNTSSPQAGFPLSANESVDLPVEDLTQLYVAAGTANDIICWIAQ